MNPFAQVKAAIRSYIVAHWQALGASNAAYVKVNNRWERDDRKNARLAADTPAVDLIPVEPNTFSLTSSSGLFERSYELGIATDGTTPDDVLDPVEWELVRAALKMQTDRLGLTSGSLIVVSVAVTGSRQTFQDIEASRNRRTWTGAVVLTVRFQVQRADILPAT